MLMSGSDGGSLSSPGGTRTIAAQYLTSRAGVGPKFRMRISTLGTSPHHHQSGWDGFRRKGPFLPETNRLEFSAGRFSGLSDRKNQEYRPDRASEDRGSRGNGGVLGRIRRLPLGAKIAASLIVAILAANILFRTYITDSVSNSRRTLLYLLCLLLFGLSGWLWWLSAPQ